MLLPYQSAVLRRVSTVLQGVGLCRPAVREIKAIDEHTLVCDSGRLDLVLGCHR